MTESDCYNEAIKIPDTMQEMLGIICDCLEIEYPGLIELEKKYFGLSLKSDENEDESQ